MEIELNRLTAVDTLVQGEVRPADAGGRAGEALPAVRFEEPLRVDLRARRQGDVARVAGRIHGDVQLQCGRCLQPVRWPVDLDFEARFAEASTAPHSPLPRSRHANEEEDEGIQLSKEDLDVSFLPAGAHALAVAEIVREQVLLEVPLRPLCREDCAGLCPRCGADLNQGPCDCPDEPEQPVDGRLAALAAIKKKLESDKN
jgi:uncharacterized protein